ncbi:hypothetical protein B0H17DRAFT_1139285 [Mycena rosella]|uniref:Uncharacterized protein n=1 Tax=Mycena rosella TaxID=1033263 RepID=A0AAD7G8T8_MYCRO|nr:hypothetical protein B0H17DRAFT_1139285 [Mycena rosella]
MAEEKETAAGICLLPPFANGDLMRQNDGFQLRPRSEKMVPHGISPFGGFFGGENLLGAQVRGQGIEECFGLASDRSRTCFLETRNFEPGGKQLDAMGLRKGAVDGSIFRSSKHSRAGDITAASISCRRKRSSKHFQREKADWMSVFRNELTLGYGQVAVPNIGSFNKLTAVSNMLALMWCSREVPSLTETLRAAVIYAALETPVIGTGNQWSPTGFNGVRWTSAILVEATAFTSRSTSWPTFTPNIILNCASSIGF